MIDKLLNSEWLYNQALPWVGKFLLVLAIFLAGRWLASIARRLLVKILERSKLEALLCKFLGNILYGVLLVAVTLASLDTLGVNIASLLTVVGAAGLAVGLALKDSLSNFAAGVMLVIFRPFKVGDYVNAGGVAGTVDEIDLFSTLFRTVDNQRVIVPNSAILSGVITNVNTLGTRRIDLTIGIGYQSDINKALDVLRDIVANEPRVLANPEPSYGVIELAESSVNLYFRPWVNASEFLLVKGQLLHTIKERFDQAGIVIPFPQRDVHLYQQLTVED